MRSIRQSLRKRLIDRRNKVLSADLRLILEGNGVTLVDIGAAGGLQDRWQPFTKSVDLVAVEPDPRALETIEKLETATLKSLHRINSPLAEKAGEVEFFLCKHPRQSSVLRPNPVHFEKYHDGHKWEVVETIRLNAMRLDDALLPKIKADFLKLDTQGSELGILRGSELVLDSCLGIEVEVEFREMYLKQPLFGDVADFLTSKNLDFIDFVAFGKWERSRPDGLRTFLGELIHADALFLRSPDAVVGAAVRSGDKVQLIKYLAILYIYSRSDMLRATLSQAKENRLLTPEYLTQLTQMTERIDDRLHKYQSRLNLLSGLTSWTGPELRFNVAS
jgi:FkbM family methyltransferase